MVNIRNSEKRVGNQMYPWDRWFKRRKFTLKRGVHYLCEQHSMLMMVRQRALTRKVRVKVVCTDGIITVTRKGR